MGDLYRRSWPRLTTVPVDRLLSGDVVYGYDAHMSDVYRLETEPRTVRLAFKVEGEFHWTVQYLEGRTTHLPHDTQMIIVDRRTGAQS